MNAQFEFGGDRREVEVGLSDVERKVLEREETMLEDNISRAETTLLSAGHHHLTTNNSLCIIIIQWNF